MQKQICWWILVQVLQSLIPNFTKLLYVQVGTPFQSRENIKLNYQFNTLKQPKQ